MPTSLLTMRQRSPIRQFGRIIAAATAGLLLVGAVHADIAESLSDAIDDRQWDRLENSVDKALAYLATQQERDGSFKGHDVGQPAITSLAIMAFISRGHQPGAGPHGAKLEKAIDFVLDTQERDGLFTYLPAPGPYEKRQPSHTATYNHAIAGLMLGEVYGMCTGKRSERVRRAIQAGLVFTWRLQRQRKDRASDEGGWRYIHDRDDRDSDISVSGWHLMFMRSAKNAEFDVPKPLVDAALGYVRRCYVDSSRGTFSYFPGKSDKANRTMTGIGALSLALGGQHRDPMVRKAADWMLRKGMDDYNDDDRWHYCHYYMVQAMAQVGGDHWRQFFPGVLNELLRHQRSNGSWRPGRASESYLGAVYFTSLGVLTLTPPYQLLPLYQR